MKDQRELTYCEVGSTPKNDDGYFEQMTKAVFRSGFNWDVVEKKWPGFKKAFVNFAIERVAGFGGKDMARLMKDQGIVRNSRKILSTIDNAKKLVTLKKEHGSFRHYLESISKDGEEKLCQAITKQFSHVGDSMVVSFLRSVGEEMPTMSKHWIKKHF